MPAKLGGATGSVTQVRIDDGGLSIGGAGVGIPIPDFKVGSAKAGFAISQARATLTVAGDYSYNVTVGGTATVNMPGATGSATGSIELPSDGSLRGSISGMALKVAGMDLAVQNFRIVNETLMADTASLKTPAAFGGFSAAVYNVQVSPDGLSIGGGAFSLPGIKVGGFQLGLKGELREVGDGYELMAGGLFQAPNLGSSGGCSGIGVSVTIYTDSFSQMALRVQPPTTAADRDLVTRAIEGATTQVSLTNATFGGERVGTQAFALREASLTLKCQIPIGATGLFLTSASGTISLRGDSTTVSLAVEVAAGRKVLDVAVVSAEAQATLTSQPFQMDISGVVKMFIFKVAGGSATIKPDSLKATLFINYVTYRGSATIKAWSSSGGFKFTGSGKVEIGLHRGQLFSGCVPYVETPCVEFPFFDAWFGGIGADVGAFKGDRWGIKGWIAAHVPIVDKDLNVSAYIDTRGTVSIGNADGYQLENGPALQSFGRRSAASTTASTSNSPVKVQAGTDPTFSLTRFGDAPQLTIVDPSGTEFTPTNHPANVHYGEIVTYTVVPDTSWYNANATFVPATGTLAPLTNPATVMQLAAIKQRLATTNPASLPAPRLRLLNARSTSGLDLLVDGVPQGEGVAFAAAANYRASAPGVRTVQLVAAGTTSPALATAQIELLPQMDYTLVAQETGGGPSLTLLADANQYRSTARAKLRLFNTTGVPVTVREVSGRTLFTRIAANTLSDDQQVFVATPDLQIEDASGTPLTTISQPTTSVGSRYTLLVAGQTGQVTATLTADAQPYAQLNVTNLSSTSADILIDGQRDARFGSVAQAGRSGYQAFVPGSYTLTLVPAGTSGPALATAQVTLEASGDYTLLGYGGAAALLRDTNVTPQQLGQVRVRVVNGATDGQPVELAQTGGSALSNTVAPGAASEYAVLAAGSSNLELRRNGAVVFSLPNSSLTDGATIAVHVSGAGAQLQATLATELAVARQTTQVYGVDNAPPGTWLQRLSNIPSGGVPSFVNAAFASARPPELSDAQASVTGPRKAQISWKLNSVKAVGVSVYATTATPDKQDGTGTLLLDSLALPTDGSQQHADVDLSALPSGTYYLYLAATDGDMPAVKAYAPQAITVAQAWTTTWDARAQVTPAYRALDLSWQPHPNPDVAGYVIEATEVGGVGATRVITVGKLLTYQITNLTPGATYMLLLRAVDELATHSAAAQAASGVPLGAPFTLGALTGDLRVRAGERITASLALSTALADYPELVGLVADAAPSGFTLTFGQPQVKPTLGGVAVGLGIQTAATLPSGVYSIPLVAQGPGAKQTLLLKVTVDGLGFRFLDAIVPQLNENQTVTVSVPTEAINGGLAPITLDLTALPTGLSAALNAAQVPVGQAATLTLSDTALLEDGSYTFQIQGTDGPNTVSQPLGLRVSKPGFALTAARDHLSIKPGARDSYRLQVVGRGGWSEAVALSVDPAMLPEGVTIEIAAARTGAELAADAQTGVRVGPGGGATATVAVSTNVADGVYIIPITATSGGKIQTLEVYLGINVANWVGANYELWLPYVTRSAVLADLTKRQFMPLVRR